MKLFRILPLFAAMMPAAGVACSLLVDTDGFDQQAAVAEAGVQQPTNNDGGGPLNDQDAGGDARSRTECPSFALLCDDFESNGTAAARWPSSESDNGGFVELVTTTAHSGTHSAHAVANAVTDSASGAPAVRANLRVNLPERRSSGMIALRVYVFLPKLLAFDTSIMKMHAVGTDDMNVKTGGLDSIIKVDTDTSGSGPDRVANASMPINKWVCLEWRATLGSSGHQTLLMDDKVIIDADEDVATDNGWNSVSLGFYASDGNVSQEAYYDDVVVALEPVGCLSK